MAYLRARIASKRSHSTSLIAGVNSLAIRSPAAHVPVSPDLRTAHPGIRSAVTNVRMVLPIVHARTMSSPVSRASRRVDRALSRCVPMHPTVPEEAGAL